VQFSKLNLLIQLDLFITTTNKMNNPITSALTNSSSDRQKELLIYFQNLEQQTDGWKLSINELTNNRANLDDSAVFFYLKIIESYIKNRFESDNDENKFLVKKYVYDYFVSKKYDYQQFLLNKYAAIINALFLIEYPLGNWTTFFEDFLAQCNTKESSGLFLRILDQINTDIGDREHILTIKESEKSTLIKDLMRENAVNLIVQFWFNLISTYSGDSDPSIVCYCLTIMGRYVSWIDINEITSRMPNLLNLLYNNQTRVGVLEFLHGILHKGMDPIAKATFIEQFCLLQCINDLFVKDYDKTEREFVVKLAKFFNKIGVELVECFKKLKSSKSTNDLNQLNLLFAAIDNKFLTLCRFLSNDDLEISIEVHPFTREYIQLIKNLTKQQETLNNQFQIADSRVQEIILVITKILIKNCKYPLDYDFSTDLVDGDDDESEFESYRHSCNVLFDNLNLLHKEFFSEFVCVNIIEPTLKSDNLMKLKFNELEIALYFLKCIGDCLETKNNAKFIELLNGLITNSIVKYPHISITIMYFELICKYEKHFSNRATLGSLMPQVLLSFLDENGLKSPLIRLRCRVTTLFNRFIRCNIKNKASNKKFLTFSEELIKSLEPIIKLDYYLSFKGKTFNEFNANEQQVKANRDNHLLLYESISYLIMQNNLIEDKKKLILLKQIFLDTLEENTNESSNLLQNMLLNEEKSMIDKVTFNKQIKVICEDIAHLINLTVFTLKAVVNGEVMKVNGVQTIYLEVFDRFARLLNLRLNEDCLNPIQQSLCHFLHRLIVCLDEAEILPLLPLLIRSVFLPQSYFTVSTIQEIVPLINQFVTKFKHSWMFHQNLLPFLNEFFLPFVSYIFELTNSGSLEDEDKSNLQKAYFFFIWIISNNVPEVLKNLDDQVFDQILVTLVQGLEMNDPSIQKNCLNILKRMVENHEQLSKNENLTNGNLVNNVTINGQLNVRLFNYIYSTALPITLNLILKIVDQDQSDVLSTSFIFLYALIEMRGSSELFEFLNQYFTQNLPSVQCIKVKELFDAFLSKDNKQLRCVFKEFKKI